MDLEYERISDVLSVNSAQKINKMALLLARIKIKMVFSSRLRTCTLKFFLGPNHGGPYNRHGIL